MKIRSTSHAHPGRVASRFEGAGSIAASLAASAVSDSAAATATFITGDRDEGDHALNSIAEPGPNPSGAAACVADGCQNVW